MSIAIFLLIVCHNTTRPASANLLPSSRVDPMNKMYLLQRNAVVVSKSVIPGKLHVRHGMIRSLILLTLSVAAECIQHVAEAKIPRSAAAKAEFKRVHPCPSTGLSRGACPGFVVDHVHPLCAGGADHPGNMQWQAVSDAKKKDRAERRLCGVRSRYR